MTTIKTIEIAQGQFIDGQKESELAQGHDLLVMVAAVSLNPVDLKHVATFKTGDLRIVGYDSAGTVIGVGEQVTDFQIGDQVYYAGTTTRDGSFQEAQLIDERLVAKKPAQLAVAEAAAFPLVSLTAYELLFEKFNFIAQAGANEGKSILLVNGAGGVGSVASQLAKWAGLTVYATASPRNFDWLIQHGVDVPVDYHAGQPNSLDQFADNQFDAVAVFYSIESYLPRMVELAKPFGHIGTIVGTQKPIDIALLKNKALSFDWEFMFTKAREQYRMASQGQILSQITDLLATGDLKSITTKTYQGLNAANLNAASELLAAGHTVGKITLIV
ncbi:zinc-binding dehydrogenase [Loigolactobacillus coryniformis]|uniref:alcohol dehydrogenase catalytic domain-containing protein n=1 Tax=Loigolactobacillus coryniformis TaxID=1610 RepID=UPI00201AB298|nr:zinc-binding dehydrogenase [Loigolactobacillus coryniformis]MCL5458851.1 zinc-binding dehydrogenase [Loigolactobacillus coryniformis]